jgi:hypothetical protein
VVESSFPNSGNEPHRVNFIDEAQNELAEQSPSIGVGQPRGKVRKRATSEPLNQETQQSQRPE